MSFLKKKPQGTAEVHFSRDLTNSTEQQGSRTCLSTEDIAGHVVFKLSSGVKFARSKILLKGVVTTRTDENRSGVCERKWRTEKLSVRYLASGGAYLTIPSGASRLTPPKFLAVTLSSEAGPKFTAADGVVKIPFRFNLEECKRASAIAELPPSIDSLEEIKWWSGWKNTTTSSQFDITYSISATAYSSKGQIASTSWRLNVLPVTEAQPPLSPGDFGGEYFLAASSPTETRRSQRNATSNHRVEVAGQEPEPISLDASSESTSSATNIPFVIKLLPGSSGTSLDPTQFPDRCELRARLVTRTFITPNGSKRILPTMEDTLADDDAQVRTSRSNEQAFTIAIPKWDQYSPDPSTSFAITRFPFLFTLKHETQLMPTFFTPILSRRYAIECKLSFPGTSNSTLELSLPLQIVYGADDEVQSATVRMEKKWAGND